MIAARRLSSWSGVLCVGGLLAGLTSCSSGGSSGSGSGGGTTTPTLASGGATTVYAIQSTGSMVTYSLSASGTISPSITLLTPSGFVPYSVAVDKSTGSGSGTLYVGGTLGAIYEVLAYTSGFAAGASPARTITGGSLATFGTPLVLAVDGSGNLYVASDAASIAIYSSSATGNATPTRVIIGANTLLNTLPQGMAVDSSGNVYVSTVNTTGTTYTGQIYEYASGATGNVAPTNKVTSSTQIFFGLAVDASNNLYAVTEAKGPAVTSASPSIVEYAAGGQTTVKTITSASAFVFLAGLSSDSVGNVYTINQTSTSSFSVLGFGPAQTGSTIPALTVTLSSFANATSGQIAVK